MQFRHILLASSILAFFLFQAGGTLHAQYMVKPNFKRLLPKGNTYKLGWWQLEGGGVYNFPTSGTQSRSLIENEDTSYSAKFTPGGGFSYSARIGRYAVTPDLRFFKYIDYSIGYRRVVGREDYEATMISNDPTTGGTQQWSGMGEFDESYLMFDLNMNNMIQVTDHSFIQNTLGLNGEYRIQDGTIGYSGRAFQLDPEQPPSFIGRINYRLGFGMRLTEQFFIVPSLQTPVLNLYPLDGASTMPILNSRYRTVSLNIKLMFLKRHRPSGY